MNYVKPRSANLFVHHSSGFWSIDRPHQHLQAWQLFTCRRVYITDSVCRLSRLSLPTGALGAVGAFRFVDFSQNCECDLV